MTQVDFYILKSKDAQARQRFACRLGEKAYRLGHKVFIQTESQQQSRSLDDLLWTFRAGSFVPHALAANEPDSQKSPILIGAEQTPDLQSDVLINLATEVPDGYERFERIAELVDQEPATKKAGRQRFKCYKDAGCAVTSHKIGSAP